MLDFTANGHVHALLPCYDLHQPLCHPLDLSKASHQREDFFFYIIARPVILLFSLIGLHLMYHPTSTVFLIYRIQKGTYWNSFALSFSEQCNTVQSTKTSLHIYEQPIFKQCPPQAKKIITKKITLNIVSIHASELTSMVLAVPYRE